MKQSIQEKINKITAARDAYNKLMTEQGIGMVNEMATDIMAEFPELAAIEWDQYTPYFNDGDSCNFSIHEPSLEFSEEGFASLSAEEKKCFYEVRGKLFQISNYRAKMSPRTNKLSEALQEFYGVIQDLSSVMEETFGDHMTVRIEREGNVSAEECQHD